MKNYSRQREAIMNVLRSTNTHPTAAWIYEQVRQQIPNISLGTVYRNLAALSESGDILSINVGDGQEHYDEVNTMKQIAIDRGIPSEDIFMDHAGFNTYNSLYRARDVFLCKRVLIVTQDFHLHRALYIADSLGLEAYGVSASIREYDGIALNEVREIAARTKDFFVTLFKVDPICLGEEIPISGNGNLTNDKEFD